MLEPYIPKKFCREFAELGCNQLPLIMAAIKGLKPLTDIWVQTNKFLTFKKICEKYKLKLEPDCIFITPNKEALNKIFNKFPNYKYSTTKCIGVPFNINLLNKIDGSVHVFISKYTNYLFDAKRFGWYPLFIDDEIIDKPSVDHLRFGKTLGYPDCCIKFFNKSHKPEIPMYYNRLKNTKGKNSYYCNNILNPLSYSYIHHSTCSLDCKKSIGIAKHIEEAIYKEEPEYVELIKKALKLPIITFGEKKSYVFDGYIKKNKIYYKDFVFIGDSIDDIYGERLKKGNNVEVNDCDINVFLNEKKIDTIKKNSPYFGFLLSFE